MYDRYVNILLSVLNNTSKASLQDDIKSLSEEEWRELLSLAQQHNIIPLVCDGIATYRKDIPQKVFAKLAGLTLIAEDKYEARIKVLKELAALMEANNIPFMVLKGYGISLFYPIPNHRTFSDIDTYNFGRFEDADNILAKEIGVKIDGDVHHHTTCVYKGVLIENHYDFINTSQHNSNLRFEQILKEEAAKGTIQHKIGDVAVILPSAMFNALFLMRHMASHYAAERVSLRHLCDWMQFIKAEHQNIDWTRVNDIYKEFNMKRFADAITRICITHLGMENNLIPDVICDEKLEERILRDIILPEFTDEKPSGFVRIVWWKTRRYFSNRWKHKLIYNESWLWTFFQSAYAHLLKPKTITH